MTDAVEAEEGMDLYGNIVDRVSRGGRVDYVIVDEAQFLAPDQIDQLARVVDDLKLDVFAFGITTDFRTKLFPGSQRLIELADRIEALPGRGALLVRGPRHAQRPDGRRGHGGRGGTGRRRGRRPAGHGDPLGCSAAVTTVAG
ncbi:Thymidine kinase [Streptomyces badius]